MIGTTLGCHESNMKITSSHVRFTVPVRALIFPSIPHLRTISPCSRRFSRLMFIIRPYHITSYVTKPLTFLRSTSHFFSWACRASRGGTGIYYCSFSKGNNQRAREGRYLISDEGFKSRNTKAYDFFLARMSVRPLSSSRRL